MRFSADPRYPIIDGFLLDATLRTDLKFRSLAIEQYEALRRSGSYRSRYWCVPPDSSSGLQIPAWGSYELQIQMVPGSAIWGFIWTPLSGDLTGPFSIQARDACTDEYLFSEVIRTDQYNFTNGDVPPPYQQALSRLWVIGGMGLVSVQICSQQTSSANAIQMIFCGGEPVAP